MNMKYIVALAISATLAAYLPGCGKGAGDVTGGGAAPDLPIGRMKVSVMPEYDDPGVLVVYDGKFEEAPSYPIKTSFFIPKGSVISDACSLSHGGQHFCQLYRTVNRGGYDEVSLLLPYPNFYLSFHTPKLDAGSERKAFDYKVKANHPIRILEVDIQQPLRSTDFGIVPPGGAVAADKGGTISVIKGFNHFAYRLEGVSKGQESAFRIAYAKSDPKPSVDIKYTPMRTLPSQDAPYEAQRNVRPAIYVLFGTGVALLLAVAVWFVRSRRKKRGGTP